MAASYYMYNGKRYESMEEVQRAMVSSSTSSSLVGMAPFASTVNAVPAPARQAPVIHRGYSGISPAPLVGMAPVASTVNAAPAPARQAPVIHRGYSGIAPAPLVGMASGPTGSKIEGGIVRGPDQTDFPKMKSGDLLPSMKGGLRKNDLVLEVKPRQYHGGIGYHTPFLIRHESLGIECRRDASERTTGSMSKEAFGYNAVSLYEEEDEEGKPVVVVQYDMTSCDYDGREWYGQVDTMMERVQLSDDGKSLCLTKLPWFEQAIKGGLRVSDLNVDDESNHFDKRGQLHPLIISCKGLYGYKFRKDATAGKGYKKVSQHEEKDEEGKLVVGEDGKLVVVITYDVVERVGNVDSTVERVRERVQRSEDGESLCLRPLSKKKV